MFYCQDRHASESKAYVKFFVCVGFMKNSERRCKVEIIEKSIDMATDEILICEELSS